MHQDVAHLLGSIAYTGAGISSTFAALLLAFMVAGAIPALPQTPSENGVASVASQQRDESQPTDLSLQAGPSEPVQTSEGLLALYRNASHNSYLSTAIAQASEKQDAYPNVSALSYLLDAPPL